MALILLVEQVVSDLILLFKVDLVLILLIAFRDSQLLLVDRFGLDLEADDVVAIVFVGNGGHLNEHVKVVVDVDLTILLVAKRYFHVVFDCVAL